MGKNRFRSKGAQNQAETKKPLYMNNTHMDGLSTETWWFPLNAERLFDSDSNVAYYSDSYNLYYILAMAILNKFI